MKPSADERAYKVADLIREMEGKCVHLPIKDLRAYGVAFIKDALFQAYADGRASRDADIETAVREERKWLIDLCNFHGVYELVPQIRARTGDAGSGEKRGGGR